VNLASVIVQADACLDEKNTLNTRGSLRLARLIAGAERLTAYVLERTNPEEEDTDELDKDLDLLAAAGIDLHLLETEASTERERFAASANAFATAPPPDDIVAQRLRRNLLGSTPGPRQSRHVMPSRASGRLLWRA